jgi:cytochrome c oxidase subunit 3
VNVAQKAQLTPTGRFGMRLFLLSLSVLFAASIVGILVIRMRAAVWPPEGAPPVPAGLWLSTLLILASSATMGLAQKSAAREQLAGSFRYLLATDFLALLFLVNQTANWARMLAVPLATKAGLFVFAFLLLTGLHALHVLGGLGALALTTARARKRSLTGGMLAATATYWHFLTVVWLVLFAVLELAL